MCLWGICKTECECMIECCMLGRSVNVRELHEFVCECACECMSLYMSGRHVCLGGGKHVTAE